MLIPCHNSNVSFGYVQTCVDTVANWFADYMLVLNVAKTHAMLFTLNNNYYINQVSVLGEAIKYVQSVKFLGCNIDPQLKWHEHIDSVCRAISRGKLC